MTVKGFFVRIKQINGIGNGKDSKRPPWKQSKCDCDEKISQSFCKSRKALWCSGKIVPNEMHQQAKSLLRM